MSNYGIVEKNKNKIIGLIDSGRSATSIAKELGCGKSSVLKKLSEWGVKSHHKSKVNPKNLLKDKTAEVIRLYKSGVSANQIAKQLGHTGPNVLALLRKEKVEIVDFRYSVDETFFDKIDSEAKAYVLGWFYADGCVDIEGKMRIQIQAEDRAVLEEIKKLMGYDGPLLELPPPKKFPHRKAQISLQISRKTLADKLIALGCTPNKSLTITMPTRDQVPQLYFNHFIRGIYDGDGSISIKKGKYVQCSITSTDIFLQPLREFLATIGIETKHYYRHDHTNTLQMMISKTDHSVRFLQWLYRDAHVSLSRKKDKFDKFMEDVYNKVEH
jgi:DNA-binding CsgD family transcriptional regulator